MGTPFLGEIRIMSFNFAPKTWARCDGQSLPINQNQALFALLGTTFGGNGQTTFQLPDFRGRVPMHFGSSHDRGERAGEEAHTVSLAEMPAHTHFLFGSSVQGNATNPRFGATGHVLAVDPANVYRNTLSNLTTIQPATVGQVGGSQPHFNMQPYLTLTFCIALQGLFPSQN